MTKKPENLRSKIDQEELKRESLKRLKETLLAIDQWKRDSLASQHRY